MNTIKPSFYKPATTRPNGPQCCSVLPQHLFALPRLPLCCRLSGCSPALWMRRIWKGEELKTDQARLVCRGFYRWQQTWRRTRWYMRVKAGSLPSSSCWWLSASERDTIRSDNVWQQRLESDTFKLQCGRWWWGRHANHGETHLPCWEDKLRDELVLARCVLISLKPFLTPIISSTSCFFCRIWF